MKLQLGYGKHVYGTVETTPDGLHYDGDDRDVMKNLVESARRPGEDDAALLARLPTQFNGRVWARDPSVRSKQPSTRQKGRQPPGPPTWKEGPGLPPEVIRHLEQKGATNGRQAK